MIIKGLGRVGISPLTLVDTMGFHLSPGSIRNNDLKQSQGLQDVILGNMAIVYSTLSTLNNSTKREYS